MTTRITRREFFLHATVLAAMLPVSRRSLRAGAPITLRIGFVDTGREPARRQRLGIDLGIDEARHGAQLFGGAVELTTLTSPSATDGALSAIIGGGDARTCAEWSAHAAKAGTIYLNVGCTSDDLRGARCNRAAFHVVPSDAMARDAIAMAGAGAGATVVAWDASLSRFGADTLNERFRARFNEAMTADAWTTWFAVKLLWESALRQRAAAAAAIAEYLARDTTQFDGHKGQPLSFRAWDHQLRQPVYVSTAGADGKRTMKEVPLVTAEAPIRETLDRIGAGPTATRCRMAP